MKIEILTVCDQIIAAVANGVYQGAILALLVGVGLKWFGRSNAATRHGVWLATLVLLLAIIPAHYWLDQRDPNPEAAGREAVAAGNFDRGPITSGAPGAGAIAPWLSRAPGFEYSPFRLQERLVSEAATPFINLWQQPGTPGADRPQTDATLEPALLGAPSDEVPKQSDQWPRSLLKPHTWNLASGLRAPRLTGAMLVGLWCALATLRLALLLRRLYQLQKLKAGSMPACPELETLFQRLIRQSGVGRKVELKVSSAQRSPVVLGFLHPAILLPATEAARPDMAGTEQILRHELAHVRRGDDWANLIQHCIQAACFFHPAVWWVSRRLMLEREIACDDHVLEQGGRRRAYALLLAELADRMKRCPPLPAPGVFNNKSQLKQRISMILDTRRNTSPRLAKTRLGFITSAAALLAVLALYSAPRLVLAQTQTATATAATASSAAVALAPQAAVEATLVVSEADPPSIPSEESGPKFKPDGPVTITPMPALAGQPELSTPLTALAASPTPPAPAVAHATLGLLVAPASPGFPAGSAPVALGKWYVETPRKPGDIEQRLERLERMVQSLMAERRPKAATGNNASCDSASMTPQEMQKIKDMAQREAAQAAQQARMAADETKRASRELERAMREKNAWALGIHQESGQQQIEALRQARQSLEREMQRLDAEIKRLEQQQQRLEQDQKKPAPEHRGRYKPQKDQTSDDAEESEPPAKK